LFKIRLDISTFLDVAYLSCLWETCKAKSSWFYCYAYMFALLLIY